MIGYGKFAVGRRFAVGRYHKVSGDDNWAKCDAIWLRNQWPDDEEDKLRAERPNLERCPRCWPADARYAGPPEGN